MAQNAQKSSSSPLNRQNQQQQQYSPQHSPQPQEHQRRESLVKPTWQNVCPGEVPFDTLEKLSSLSNGEQHSILLQQQVNFSEKQLIETDCERRVVRFDSKNSSKNVLHVSYKSNGVGRKYRAMFSITYIASP